MLSLYMLLILVYVTHAIMANCTTLCFTYGKLYDVMFYILDRDPRPRANGVNTYMCIGVCVCVCVCMCMCIYIYIHNNKQNQHDIN